MRSSKSLSALPPYASFFAFSYAGFGPCFLPVLIQTAGRKSNVPCGRRIPIALALGRGPLDACCCCCRVLDSFSSLFSPLSTSHAWPVPIQTKRARLPRRAGNGCNVASVVINYFRFAVPGARF
jgi:hypothetical protein